MSMNLVYKKHFSIEKGPIVGKLRGRSNIIGGSEGYGEGVFEIELAMEAKVEGVRGCLYKGVG